jgi:hypothetical protein
MSDLWPITVTLDGADLALDAVLADVTIRHGRSDIWSPADAATAQLTLVGVDRAFTHAFKIGGELAITVQETGSAGEPRFTGTVTDAALDVDALTVVAVGLLGTLWRHPVGTGDWPTEAWSARVTRAFTEAGLASSLLLEPDPSFDPPLAARPGNETRLSDYLTPLADSVGAAVVDLPDGRILVQAINSRSFAGSLELDPADVIYAPVWAQALAIANVVTVKYAGGELTATDQGSFDANGPFPIAVETELANQVDAQTLANQTLTRRAYPRWMIQNAPLITGYQAVKIGAPVSLTELPDPSPYGSWTPCLEGWDDRIQGGEWLMTLALSDPLFSGLTLTWDAAPGQWNTIDQTVAWRDALAPSDLVPA